MNSKLKQFHFLSESNKNIDFVAINENALMNFFRDIKNRGLVGLNILGDENKWKEYLSNEKLQGPVGRLGSEYKEAATKVMLAPYRLAPQRLVGSVGANLRRMGLGKPSSDIQYGPTSI
jgi:hypothetical protein